MNTEWIVTTNHARNVAHILLNRKRSDLVLFFIILGCTLCLVPLLVMEGAAVGASMIFALMGVVVVVALLLRWPSLGFFVVLLCALVIDQAPLPLLDNKPEIYLFYWPPSLEGLPDRPIGFFMLFLLLLLFIRGLLQRKKTLQGGALLLPYLGLLLCVVWGVVHGLTSGGQLKIIVNEVRSFWYLFISYLLAYNLVNSKKHLRAIFWCVILCAGIKAFEALYIYLFVIHGDLAANHEIMSHEESYFWISILLLIVLFSLHHKYKPQLYTALALVPVLLIALVANNRRVDFLALPMGLFVAWLLTFLVRPEARKSLLIVLIVTALIGGAYIAAFGNGRGGLSTPARAVISMFHPDPNDAASNLYRDIENYDLQYTVKLNPMGLGFGKPFLQPILLPNILSLDPVYLYIPHNTIYWVWMRLGPIGYLALWYLFGTIIVRACITARQLKDKYFQLTAIYIAAMALMEIVVAYADYQLSFYRNVIYIGILAGILIKLPLLDKQQNELQEPKKDISIV